jgi:DNA-binding transcriptional LysR family regulator
MKITLRQLLVFDAVATLGGVTRAADSLGMSQSAASAALADLQIALGRPLFAHARGRPLQITDEGKRLHPIVRSVLGQLGDIERGDGQAPLAGQLVIGATEMIAETFLPRLCVDFMEIHPDVRFKVEVETARTLIERMTRFEIETALIEVLPEIPGIALTPWRTDELVLVAKADHPLAQRKHMRIADLAGHAWCMREGDSSISARLRYLLHAEIGQIPVAFEATSNWAVRHAVIAGGGIGCLSRALVQFDLDNGRLVALDVADFAFARSLSLARPAEIWRGRLPAAFDAFLLAHGD